jgi:rubrerythrin
MSSTIFNENNGDEKEKLAAILKSSIEIEEELMRTYLIAAERIHNDDELKDRLENFAEGNAKRTKQLIDELNNNNGK